MQDVEGAFGDLARPALHEAVAVDEPAGFEAVEGGIKISLCFRGVQASPVPERQDNVFSSRDLRYTSPYASKASDSGPSEENDVNSIGGGGKPSLHGMK